MPSSSRFPQRDVTHRTGGPAVNAAGDGLEGAYSAQLHSVPSGGTCKVVIPALDLTSWKTAHCSQAFTGSIGDTVLVMFDENKDPWVLSPSSVTSAAYAVARKSGAVSAWTSIAPSNTTPLTDGSTGLMQISITPSVAVWWEVNAQVTLYKVDTNYNYVYPQILLSTADQDGISQAMQLATQNATVQTYASYTVVRKFRLAAGIAYTASLLIGVGSGGTWQANTGPAMQFIEGKAWAQ